MNAELTRSITITVELSPANVGDAFAQLSADGQAETIQWIALAFECFGAASSAIHGSQADAQAQILAIAQQLQNPDRQAARKWLRDLIGFLGEP